MKSRFLKWAFVLILLSLAAFLLACGILGLREGALEGASTVASLGRFLLDLFSFGLFLFPIWLLVLSAALVSKKFPTADGLLIAALLLPSVLLASFWSSLVFPGEVDFYRQFGERLQANYGSFGYILYLALFFFVVLLTFLAPIRIFILTLEEDFCWGGRKDNGSRTASGDPAPRRKHRRNKKTTPFDTASDSDCDASPSEAPVGSGAPADDEAPDSEAAAAGTAGARRFDFLKRLQERQLPDSAVLDAEQTDFSGPAVPESGQPLAVGAAGVEINEKPEEAGSVFCDGTAADALPAPAAGRTGADDADSDAFEFRPITYDPKTHQAGVGPAAGADFSPALPDAPDALLQSFPNIRRLLSVVHESEAGGQPKAKASGAAAAGSPAEDDPETDIDFSDIQGEDLGLRMLQDSYVREAAEAEAEAESEDDDVSDLEDADEANDDEWSDGVLRDSLLFDESELKGSRPGGSRAAFSAKPYVLPVNTTLKKYNNAASWEIDEETKSNGEVLQKTFEEFNIQAEVIGIQKGPVITMFEILPAPGVKLSKIVGLQDNIALRLAAPRVRIVAPIPGKHAVGIEIPNRRRALVSFREMVEDKKFEDESMQIPVILGKDVTGNAQIIDLTATPHLLIAGATGSGKSVCVNSLITSILFKKRPDQVKLLLIDPKIVELKLYNDVPHLLTSVITEPKKAFQALQYCLSEMERRYALLDSLSCRDIKSFNKKAETKKFATEKLPYIVVIVDEFADLMATTGKELESTLARLAAMSRAVGIHLVLATQRPSIDVITGLIKANIPSRIAFMVAGKMDSRIILDAVGAEKLLGKGDMLFSASWDPIPIRIQGAFLSDDEVERVVEQVKTLGEPEYMDDEIFIEEEDTDLVGFSDGGDDPLMNRATEIVGETGKASASYLQRRLKIGYNRAARMVEEMEKRGLVGPQNGSKPREVLFAPERM